MPKKPMYRFVDAFKWKGKTNITTQKSGRRYGRANSTLISRFVGPQLGIRKRRYWE